MIMFMAYNNEIKPVQTSSANKYYRGIIWVDGMLQETSTEWCSYHPSWQEAQNALFERATKKVFDIRKDLYEASLKLHKVRILEPIRQKRAQYDFKAFTSGPLGDPYKSSEIDSKASSHLTVDKPCLMVSNRELAAQEEF